jgi:predicted CXXCH cytochrome family protein
MSLALAAPGVAQAGNWHRGANLLCSDCHTMHNSNRGLPMRYDLQAEAAPFLLRNATAESLCEQCHSGGPAGANAPSVVGVPDTAYAAVDPAGGFFTRSIDGLTLPGLGHTLGVAPPVVPLSTLKPFALTCLSCHDAHGNGRYRNLLPSPSGSGAAAKVVPLVDSTVVADGKNPAKAYATANMLYRSGMSQWCTDCHDAYATGTAHPSDLTLSGYSEIFTRWTTAPRSAAGAPLPRLRVQNPDAIQPVPASPSSDDQVFCLTCHKAHGSSAPRALIYPDPGDSSSSCSQCHAGMP